MLEQPLFLLATQASSLLIHFCGLLDTMNAIGHHSHFLPNSYLEMQRISIGVTSFLSMCLCTQT